LTSSYSVGSTPPFSLLFSTWICLIVTCWISTGYFALSPHNHGIATATSNISSILTDKPSPVTDHDYLNVTVKLPTSGTTDLLLILISNLVYLISLKGNARLNINWDL
jgi:hypothetical protein